MSINLVDDIRNHTVTKGTTSTQPQPTQESGASSKTGQETFDVHERERHTTTQRTPVTSGDSGGTTDNSESEYSSDDEDEQAENNENNTNTETSSDSERDELELDSGSQGFQGNEASSNKIE